VLFGWSIVRLSC